MGSNPISATRLESDVNNTQTLPEHVDVKKAFFLSSVTVAQRLPNPLDKVQFLGGGRVVWRDLLKKTRINKSPSGI